MPSLMSLPNEILIEILQIVAATDFQALFVSQLTNRRLCALTRHILSNGQNPPSALDLGDRERIHPFLKSRFGPLLNTADCFTDEKKAHAFPTLNGDYTLPFCRLPWARTESRRSAYLRPEASWRNISLTFGHSPITHLDVVKSYSAPEGDFIQYYQADLEPPGLTMGHLFNALLSDPITHGCETDSWQLIAGRRLHNFDAIAGYACFFPDGLDLVDMGTAASQAAVLYIRGGPVSGGSKPEALVNDWLVKDYDKPWSLSWQAPAHTFVFSGYLE
ncbi:hypothetical protein GGS23DRAFT_17122 [Durotheca rogersii]|uniref:uncharacterized protein n=1 Tax=Durotheca rogersii TaxID=419775 RepID=UPI00222019C5|nr:uncharacterized protein GGS23DRAFT_17122 [Durotheca rogersii]KAI5868196.1 hypothetical protein GGS23DRAFT_17122 [Durotheca rogersii]